MSRFRMETILANGIAGKRAQESVVIFDAASPRISRQRVNAIASMVFVERSARSYPAVISNAVAAASRMWRSRTASGLGIQDERASNHFVSEVPAQIHGGTYVNLAPAEQPAQLCFNIREPEETDPLLRPELNEYIHV